MPPDRQTLARPTRIVGAKLVGHLTLSFVLGLATTGAITCGIWSTWGQEVRRRLGGVFIARRVSGGLARDPGVTHFVSMRSQVGQDWIHWWEFEVRFDDDGFSRQLREFTSSIASQGGTVLGDSQVRTLVASSGIVAFDDFWGQGDKRLVGWPKRCLAFEVDARTGGEHSPEVLWRGLVQNIAMFGGLWWCGLSAIAIARMWRRSRIGQCRACGYDLRGQTTPGCPECGKGRATAQS